MVCGCWMRPSWEGARWGRVALSTLTQPYTSTPACGFARISRRHQAEPRPERPSEIFRRSSRDQQHIPPPRYSFTHLHLYSLLRVRVLARLDWTPHTLYDPDCKVTMRRTLASTSRSLCASCCAQQRACAPLATAAARTYSTTRSTPRVPPQNQATQQQHQRSTQHRWLSSQSQPEAVEEAQQEQDHSQPANKKWDHTKRLPYYDLFPESLPQGPPPQGPFDIDVRALRREFLRLQAASHPDYFHSASTSSSSSSSAPDPENTAAAAKRRRQAEATSSHINAAYKTLSHPLLRAQYILAERYGVDLAGDEAGSHAGGAPADPALLMEVLEAREAIDEAESEDDLEGPMAENEERIGRCLEGLRRAFAEGDVDGAVGEAIRLRYWESIKEGIRGWEKGVGGGLLHH